MKKVMTLLIALVALIASASAAEAYSNYNTIGSYYQYGYQGGYTYEAGVAQGGQVSFGNPYYAYPSQPRAGGWFGSGSGWISGLRTPYYADVTPVNHPTWFRPTGGGHYGSQGFSAWEHESFSLNFGFY